MVLDWLKFTGLLRIAPVVVEEEEVWWPLYSQKFERLWEAFPKVGRTVGVSYYLVRNGGTLVSCLDAIHSMPIFFFFLSFFFAGLLFVGNVGGGHSVVSAAAAHLLIGDHLWTSWCFLSAFPALLPFEPFPFSSASSVLLSSLFPSSLYPPISPSFIRRRKNTRKKSGSAEIRSCAYFLHPHTPTYRFMVYVSYG